MKLLRLKITDPEGFRSLQAGFELYFLREMNLDQAGDFNPYILAGPNGSGKSNILEVLAAIFYHIECMYLDYRPDSFEYDEQENPEGFRSEHSAPDGFEIEYLIPVPPILNISGAQDNAHIKVVKEPGKAPGIFWMNRDVFGSTAEMPLRGTEIRELLPDFILGYSSGENEILSLPFFKMRFIHYDEYADFLIRRTPYLSVPTGRLIFFNSEFNQAIIASNMLLQKEELLKPFCDDVGVEDIKEFRIIIKKFIRLDENQITDDPKDTTRFHRSITSTEEDETGEITYRLDITQNLTPLIDKLRSCATCYYNDEMSNEYYLDFWVNDETKKAFRKNFESPIALFQAFQILLTLNLYTVQDSLKKDLYQSLSLYVNETVPVLPSNERIMRFENVLIQKHGVRESILCKSLSDGEHQLLHSLGLCLLFREKECLFLLDEPETHFNPDWRAKFISKLRDCFSDKEAQSTMREMLITTHTPFLISDSKEEYVLEFKKDKKSGNVKVKRPEYQTLGASINKITMKTFDKKETIGGYAEKMLKDIENRFEAGYPKHELITEADALLGESVEKMLFIKKVLDSMEKQ